MPNPEPAGLLQLQGLIFRLINISVTLAFIILTIMIVYGGIKFIISAGEPKGVEAAKLTLTYALLGIVMMIVGWLVLKLIEAFTGVPVANFCLGFPGATTGCQR